MAVAKNFGRVLVFRYLLAIILGIEHWTSLRVEGSGINNSSDFILLSAFKYPKTRLPHYDWRYFRVELPVGFSTVSMVISTDWVSGSRNLIDISNDTTPLLCIRSGGPPLPGSAESDLIAAMHVGNDHNMSKMGQCAWFQESLTFNLTDEQVSSGILYLGFFNGFGPTRTQSKMITRGSTYSIDVEIIVFGCKSSFLRGPYCNNIVSFLSCSHVGSNKHPRHLYQNPLNGKKLDQTGDAYHLGKGSVQQLSTNIGESCLLDCNEYADGGNNEKMYVSKGRNTMENNNRLLEPAKHALVCTNSNSKDKECIKHEEWKFFSVQIVDISSVLEVMVEYESFNSSASATDDKDDDSNNTTNKTKVEAVFYIRHSALPQRTSYDYVISAGHPGLSIQSPKLGWWYIGVYVSNLTKTHVVQKQEKDEPYLCFVLKWRIYTCSHGKTGENCTWKVHTLQRVKRVGASLPFESHYLPINQGESTKSESFQLEQYFNNSSILNASQDPWTFFLFEVPFGAAGGVISVELRSHAAISFDIYARFGSLPTLHDWDYHTNVSDSVKSSIFTTVNGKNKQTKMHLNIIYPWEGVWCLGLRLPGGFNLIQDSQQVTMSILLQGCPMHCSKHGTCHHAYEESGLTLFSYCSCDRTHGGFDCSIELISPKGQKRQSAALIVSNIAALLPALWSIRQKAYAEWILYTASGISSALYHSCDVGSWCALSFHVLQFMDFWLSFMAVVATFIYMSAMDEKTKLAVHASVSIITALIAVNGPTRSINVILVVIIGILGLLFGWMVELSRGDQITNLHSYFNSSIHQRWQALKIGSQNLFQKLCKRFRWRFICLGFLALGSAALSWHLETLQTYWIWHSLWHISIYTSSLFFLCSTVLKAEACTSNSAASYEPVPQNNVKNASDSPRQTELAEGSEHEHLHA